MAKVMLVEDDNNLREIYEARLAAEGYQIVSAPDGEAALALAIKEKPDLIISDIMMPKVSGFDMLDILRSTTETKGAKIIMMTALNQAEDKARAEQLGADMYLVKSQVTLEDVVKAAQKLLGDQNPSSVGGVPVEQPQTAAPATTSTSLTGGAPAPAVPAAPAPAPAQSIPVTAPAPTPAAPAPAPAPSIVTTVVPAPAVPAAPAPAPAQSIPVTAPAPTAPAPDIPATATTAEEEKVLQAQIEQFITSNPTITTTPDGAQQAATPEAAPAPAVPAAPAPAPAQSIPVTAPAPTPAETATLPEDAPAGEQKIAKSADSDTNNTEPGIDPAVSGRKKVIQPISDVLTKGPDLTALLAKEGEVVGQPSAPSVNSVITPDGVTVPSAVQDVIPPQPANTQPPTPPQPAA